MASALSLYRTIIMMCSRFLQLQATCREPIFVQPESTTTGKEGTRDEEPWLQ